MNFRQFLSVNGFFGGLSLAIPLMVMFVQIHYKIEGTPAVDNTTVMLLVIFLLPLLAYYLSSIELFGIKIGFRSVQEIEEAAKGFDLISPLADNRKPYRFEYVAEESPRLGLAGLRIEIENELLKQVGNRMPLALKKTSKITQIINYLVELKSMQSAFAKNLIVFISKLDEIIEARKIDQNTKDWVLNKGPQFLMMISQQAESKTALT